MGSSPKAIATKFRLNDGRSMPMFGLGVYRVPREDCYEAVRSALERGYRLVDTAAMYGNEVEVGRAIRDSGLRRDDVWVTSKILPRDHGRHRTRRAVQQTVDNLGLGTVDLMLIHSPTGGKLLETWDALCALRDEGVVGSVGVSNFGVEHLEALEHKRPEAPPAVNQIELHPLIIDERRDVIVCCSRLGVLVQAYGSIFSGQARYLERRVVQQAALAHHRTAAQVLLKWALQQGIAVIPKSTNPDRISENAALDGFELSQGEMMNLSAMRGKLGEYWNPLQSDVEL